MKKLLLTFAMGAAMAAITSCGGKATTETTAAAADSLDSLPTVYYIKDINSDNLMKVYEALGRDAKGHKVAVKLSTGEAGNPNHLDPNLIKALVQSVDGTIIEGNTAYAGKRMKTEDHLKVAEEHGFTAIAPVDILDAEGQVEIPVANGKHLKHDIVGKDFLDYDFVMVLSHFKGHPMAGFGGALKNISIGIASPEGKAYIHSAGKTSDLTKLWDSIPADNKLFLESMAEACEAIIDHVGANNMLYINVANNMSVDCDCVANPQPVEMKDLGIFTSLDPVAVDQACIDAINNSDDHGKQHMLERIASRQGTHILEYADSLGLGSKRYKLVELK